MLDKGFKPRCLASKHVIYSLKNNVKEEQVLSLTDTQKQNMQKYIEMNLY